MVEAETLPVPLYCPLIVNGLNDFLEIKQIFTDGTGLAKKPPYGQVIKE